jgi:hypothetical protein
VTGWTLVGSAGVGIAASLVLGANHQGEASLLISLDVLPVMTLGFGLMPSAALDEVRDYYKQDRATGRPSALVRDDVEALWSRTAATERRWRTFGGWCAIASGAGYAALDGAFLAYRLWGTSRDDTVLALEVSSAVLSLAFIGWGVQLLTSDGPVASALHAYERPGSGRPGREGEMPIAPRVALVPGGAVAAVGGVF